MSNTGIGSGFLLLWGFHILAVIAFFIGILFLIFWANKTLTAAQLKQWGWTLVIGGALLCLVTIGAMGRTWMSRGTSSNMQYKMGNHMMGMMDDDDAAMDMSMKGMSMALEGKTGDAFDAAFLQMMIPHHEGAIDMAELAKKYAGHAEIKAMADDIMTAQQREIDQMKGWQNSWGFTN